MLGRIAPLLAIVAALALVGYGAWSSQARRIENDPLYQITLDEIVVAPPLPEWITTDLKAEALRDASLDPPLSVLDPQLAERAAKAFSFHPWVAEVRQVRKTAPGGLEVDLVYRRPVAMVELPPVDGRRGLYAVDVDGILLPSRDFLDDPKKAARYPRLGGFTPADVGRVGTRWPDARIIGGAKLAFGLADVWDKLTLAKIVPTETSDAKSPATFELLTLHGSRVVWGHAPGNEAGNELSAEKKVELLLRYVADHQSLEGRDGPQQLDLRGNEIVVVAEKPKKSTTK
jgi:hypothetical protein